MARWPPPRPNTRALESRRLRAVRLLDKGLNLSEVSRRLGVSVVAVHKWRKKIREGGVDALRAIPIRGPRKRVTEQQLAILPEILARGAQAYGFPDDHWTVIRIAVAANREWKEHYCAPRIQRILRARGFVWKRYAAGGRQSKRAPNAGEWSFDPTRSSGGITYKGGVRPKH